MKELPGNCGLILNEPLLWEKGKPGRRGMSIPAADVPRADLDERLVGDKPDFPDLSEIDVVRHYTRLSQWNFGVDSGMYPLGSCTMKYNPKINERLAATAELAAAHPMLDDLQVQGTLRIMYELQEYLTAITGMAKTSLQPAAGAQGELTGMLMISAWHRSHGDRRSKILIPDTAHGTNPASAVLCGYRPVPVTSGPEGILEPEAVAQLMDEETAGIMITNPNTLGLFETHIRQIADIVHAKGGLVYGDGANLNAVMGLADAARCGVDIMHLNLHKTFSTPHGGGGPGAGPVCATRNLAPYLPAPLVIREGDRFRLEGPRPTAIGRVHAFHGNFSVLIKAYCYIRSMGAKHLKQASRLAVLNANYLRQRLKDVLHLAYDRPCMHECVFSDALQRSAKVTTLDMAKRLIDYGFHPPTIYFPLVVSGAIMIEPTETECKEDLDRFVEALHRIAGEAQENPELLRRAPLNSKLGRLDETRAARKPKLRG